METPLETPLKMDRKPPSSNSIRKSPDKISRSSNSLNSKRKSYPISKKIKVINDYYTFKNVKKTSVIHNIDRKMVREWVKNKDEILLCRRKGLNSKI